jgi:hypothetical protein
VPLLNFPELAVIDRHAFVNTLFADPRQQPVLVTNSAASLQNRPVPDALWRAAADGQLPPMNGFDDIMIVDPPPGFDPAKLSGKVLFAAPRLVVLRLDTQTTGTTQ